jgi:hypothetical protein
MRSVTLLLIGLLAVVCCDSNSRTITAQPKSKDSALALLLPLQRKAYQTNELIDISVLSKGPALTATELTMTVAGDDGSEMKFNFPTTAAKDSSSRTDHLHLNGRLLRPGNYTITVAAGDHSATTEIEVYSHIRKSSFKIVDWGSRAQGPEQASLGEDGLGFNVFYASAPLSPDNLIRGGLDEMRNCTMSGGHQMDLRLECDWSDPRVFRGGTARVVRQALMERTLPNCIGVHFYDEPGLTWAKHPKTGDFGPHNIPTQDEAYQFAFGRASPQYPDVTPADPKLASEWKQRGRWKLSFMEAAWKDAVFGVSQVRGDFLSTNQAAYGWNAFTDGYYFNIQRPFSIANGHGGYEDFGGFIFNPSYTFEMARARDLSRPNWYLPSWYANMPSDRFKMEQYLSFMMGLQGMMKPPDMAVHRPASACRATAQGIVESNKLMARLGTIFTTSTPTRPPVAMLWSMSQNLDAQVKDMKDAYDGAGHKGKTLLCYLAAKSIQQNLQPVVEEDIADGTLAAHHKAILLPGIDYLDPAIVKALELFIANGGTVLVSDESKVQVKGATKLGVPVDASYFKDLGKAWQTQNQAEMAKLNNVAAVEKAAAPIAPALRKHFEQLKITPPIKSSNPNIIVSSHKAGEIEYRFAVNASFADNCADYNAIQSAVAEISIPTPGAVADPASKNVLHSLVVYDITEGRLLERSRPETQTVRFGPGQMYMYAVTPDYLGPIQVANPEVQVDLTRSIDPIRVSLGATLMTAGHRMLAGSAPLRIRVIDPLGNTRYELYRATTRGQFAIDLPLAANDPAGEYKVSIKELIANHEGMVSFTYNPAKLCPAVAGYTPRATWFGNDRENVYRFIRSNHDLTIVTGKGDYGAAAERIAKSLERFDVKCKIVAAESINKPRNLTPDEAKTFIGFVYGKPEPGAKNNPVIVGFDVRGGVILVGNPDDNPVIASLQQQKLLPYQPKKDEYPGNGRGTIAWQLDGVGLGQESIALIGYDKEGIGEAVGTFFEMFAGLEPLTPLRLPTAGTISSANKPAVKVDEGSIVQTMVLPDRVAAIKEQTFLTNDGSIYSSLSREDPTELPTLVKALAHSSVDLKLDVVLPGRVVVGADNKVLVVTRKGAIKYEGAISKDPRTAVVTMLTTGLSRDQLVVGTSDGGLSTIDLTKMNEAPAILIAGIDRADKKAVPNPYIAGHALGKDQLLALTRNEAHIISIPEKKILQKIGGVNGDFGIQKIHGDFVVSEGRTAQVISHVDGKVLSRTMLPPDTVVIEGLSLGTPEKPVGGLVVGSEVDGIVRRIELATDKQKEKVIWEHKAPRKIVKRIAAGENGLIAVAYWGGLINVFDADGKLKMSRTLHQDVVDLKWDKQRLFVAPAEPKLLVFELK